MSHGTQVKESKHARSVCVCVRMYVGESARERKCVCEGVCVCARVCVRVFVRVYVCKRIKARMERAAVFEILQHTATQWQQCSKYCNTLQYTCNTLATHCDTLQHTATHCDTHKERRRVRDTATHCNTLQHIAARCNMLQHTATHILCVAEDFSNSGALLQNCSTCK